MSGIVGYIKNNKERKQDNLLFSKMVELLKYMGEEKIDNWKNEFLNICRVHHGITNPHPQPIFNEDSSIFIVMAGEVFDYKKEKEKLIENGHRFRFENNDAEYCLHLYEEKEEKAFEDLNGSFILAIYDFSKNEFYLVTDKFSSYPWFYYLTKDRELLFGTQMSAILQWPQVPRRLDMSAVFDFFTFRRVLGQKTYYQDIKLVPPASILFYKNGNINIKRYWKLKYNRNKKYSEKEYLNKLTEALRKSVRRRLRGSQRIGLFLSGGLDSRIILAALEKSITTLTLAEFKNQEVEIAQKAAKIKGCPHIIVKRDRDYYYNLVSRAMEIADGMNSFVGAFLLGSFNQIRKHADIFLSGNGLDFTFQNAYMPQSRYFKVLGLKIPSFLHLPKIKTDQEAAEEILRSASWKFIQDSKPKKEIFNEPYFSLFDKTIKKSIQDVLDELSEKEASFLDKCEYFRSYHSILKEETYLCVTNMRSGVDERTVIFDNDVLNIYLELPSKMSLNAKIYRKALKKLNPQLASLANARTGIPANYSEFLEKIVLFWKRLGKKIFPKKEYLPYPGCSRYSWPDFGNMFRHHQGFKDLLWQTIEDPECLDPSIFNIEKIKEIFNKHIKKEADYWKILSHLLTFGLWYKKYGPDKQSVCGIINN